MRIAKRRPWLKLISAGIVVAAVVVLWSMWPARPPSPEDRVRAAHERLRAACAASNFGRVWDLFPEADRAGFRSLFEGMPFEVAEAYGLDPMRLAGLDLRETFALLQEGLAKRLPEGWSADLDLLRSLEPKEVRVHEDRATVLCDGVRLGVPTIRIEYGREDGEWRLRRGSVVDAVLWPGSRAYRIEIDDAVPAGACEIGVIGQQWRWLFEYPGGYIDEELHVPAGRPVRLTLRSDDVIHCLAIPNFGLSVDVVPGRHATAWFQAKTPGEHRLMCSEYCGEGYSSMTSRVIVHEPDEFARWLVGTSPANLLPPVDAGRLLYRKRGCSECHSVDGTVNTGPSFKGLFDRARAVRDGERQPTDEEYLRDSLFRPGRAVVPGHEDVMPTYQGHLSDDEVAAIIAFLRTLGGEK